MTCHLNFITCTSRLPSPTAKVIGPVDVDIESVFPLPDDGRLGRTLGLALKRNVAALGADLVAAAQAVFDPRRD